MGNRCRVLIVDDDQTNQEIILEILSDRSEYVCEVAKDGEEALAVIDRFRPDIVLLDIMMPGMDGYSVTKQIRANPRHKYIKVIMVSGKATTPERLAGYEAGADDYFVKPFSEEELLAKIKVFSKLKLAEEVEQIKSSIISLSAHETRTPLHAIYMFCQLLLEDKSLASPQKDAVENIYKSAKKLNNYIDKVFRLCQLKKERSLDVATISVKAFMDYEVKKLKQEFRGQVTLHFQDPTAELHVDGYLFREAFQAITNNAVKFSAEDGEITISSGIDNGMTLISVSDQGKGILPDHLDSIFDGFSVGNFLNHHEGSGLSLAISRTIIEQHGGDLAVESRPGCGATFTIRLPLQS